MNKLKNNTRRYIQIVKILKIGGKEERRLLKL